MIEIISENLRKSLLSVQVKVLALYFSNLNQITSIMEQFNKTPIGNLCSQFTQALISHPMSLYFRKPMTDEHYLSIIKHPMDFDTIRKKLKDGQYSSHTEWKNDVDLIYSNAIEYNSRDSVAGGITVYLKNKTDKMCQKFNYFNHQNYEEAIRAANRELDEVISKIAKQEIESTPEYDVKTLSEVLNKIGDSAEAEQIIKKNGDHRVLKKSKDGVLNLDNLSRKTLDALWIRFGPK
ncbi:Bromodomain containing protein [Tritrichomonas foetus]|uniref:Bromodomain containing protein n=1 Tax=Tritrichomonas foetus TaxID=1144522 RepID=A0A1J4JJC5_9EUKA|nr:Bromodomain containing protein [Tritrichomonas foetus]|eukprot:OHS97340.1 Bromodomain containing protein [Tritrichomonas foetus]